MSTNLLFFGIYPYVALLICLVGSWARFDLSQYTWKAGSSQMLSKKGMRVYSNLFHVGVLFILAGHFVGLLTPASVYHHLISTENKQLLAMVSGGFFGVLCFIGLSGLILRRLTDARVRATGNASDLMILLARTTPLAEVKRKSEGMSIFLVDLREAIGKGLTVQPIANMVNHETNELFFDNLEIPADSLIGEEGKGFRYILDGLNAERTLIAAECIGDGRWFIDKASHYARDRVVFGRPIGQNQGVQFPIAEAHIEVEAADLMRWRACQEYDAGLNAGASANMAKYLAAKASWEAANACLQTHGGFGFACEYDVERKFRETRLYQVAPISTNLILSYVAEHLLELPRSF